MSTVCSAAIIERFVFIVMLIICLKWKEASEKYRVSVHVFVFMTNRVRLLVVPTDEDGVSRMMQSLGSNYVRYMELSYVRVRMVVLLGEYLWSSYHHNGKELPLI